MMNKVIIVHVHLCLRFGFCAENHKDVTTFAWATGNIGIKVDDIGMVVMRWELDVILLSLLCDTPFSGNYGRCWCAWEADGMMWQRGECKGTPHCFVV